MKRNYYVYILASISKVLYIGFTNCLVKRINQHKKGTFINAFSKKYKVNRLVYWEHYYGKSEALQREQQVKKYRREKKVQLIERDNPQWNDLYEFIVEMSKVKSWL